MKYKIRQSFKQKVQRLHRDSINKIAELQRDSIREKNINDLGTTSKDLIESQEVNKESGTITYRADNALYINNGYTLEDGTTIAPNSWIDTDKALKILEHTFREGFNS